MLTVLICIIIGFILGIGVISKDIDFKTIDVESFFMVILFGVMWALIATPIGFVVAIVIPSDTHRVVYEYELVSLQDTNSIEGDFFLGSGGFGGNLNYSFYHKTEDGGFKSKTIDGDYVTIYHNDNPRYEVHRTEITDATINKYSLYVGGNETVRKLFVPKGTIKENYVLDAQ